MPGTAALNFCLIELQKQSSELARTLAEVLGSRIQQQRKVHTTVLQYLHSNTARKSATKVFSILSNDTLRKFIRRLIICRESSTTTSADSDSSTKTTSSLPQHVACNRVMHVSCCCCRQCYQFLIIFNNLQIL